jgi:hypothetical protein
MTSKLAVLAAAALPKEVDMVEIRNALELRDLLSPTVR